MKGWKKTLAALVVLGAVASALAGLLYVRSERFQRDLRAIFISKMERSTGLRCVVSDSHFDFPRGRFEVSGMRLHDPAADAGSVDISVRHIRASLSISSFWRFRVRLAELTVDGPDVKLLSGNRDSSWNPEEILKALRVSLRLEAGSVTIRDGRLRVNDHVAPFRVRLDDLDCAIRYDRMTPSYRIHLQYKRSQLYWQERDIPHDLALDADLSINGIVIESLRLVRGGTELTGRGRVERWSDPVLLIHINGRLDAQDLKLAHPSLHEGRGSIAVLADLRCGSDGIHAQGEFSVANGRYRKMGFRRLAGSFQIAGDVLHLRRVTGKIANGDVAVEATIQLREANPDPNRVEVKTRSVPVIDAGRLLDLPLLDFLNAADLHSTLVWYGGGKLRADCDATIQGMPPASSGRSTRLAGTMSFTYLEDDDFQVEAADLRSADTRVRVSGGRDSVFHLQLSTARISEPLELIAGFSPPIAGFLSTQPDVKNAEGVFDLDGDVRIRSASDIDYRGAFSIAHGQWRSYRVDSLSARVDFRSPLLQFRALSIKSGVQSLNGDLDLEFLEGERIPGLGFSGDFRNVALSSLKGLGIKTEKMDGNASGRGSVRFRKGEWGGAGRVSIGHGHYGGESFTSLAAEVKVEDSVLHIDHAEVRRGATRLSAEGRVNLRNQRLDLTARLDDVGLEELPMIKKEGIPVRGRVRAGGVLTGTAADVSFSGDFDVKDLNYGSLVLGGGSGKIRFKSGLISGEGRVQSELGDFGFEAAIGVGAGNPGRAAVEFRKLRIQKLVPPDASPYLTGLNALLQGRIDVAGDFDDIASLRMKVEVDGARFRIKDYELHNAGPIRFVVQERAIRIERVAFEGEGTSFSVSGTAPLRDDLPMDVSLNGGLNLKLLEAFQPKLHAEGTAALSIRASGSRRDPQVIGQASFKDSRLDYPGLPFRFSGLRGDVVFSRDLIRLENIQGQADAGAIRISGVLEHRNSVIRSLNLGISLRNARLPYPKEFRSVADADLVLSGNGDVHILSGDVRVTRMEYLRSFNLLEQLASRSPVQSGPLTTDPYLLGLRLNVEIHSENGLSIDNELTRLRGSLRLTLRGTPAYPSLTGRVEASEGTIFFRGSRFEISHASADFIDRNRINPVLEIRAEADVKTYRLILDAAGDLEHLNLNITSDPPMSTVDILSLLTTGKRESAASTSQRQSQMAGMSAASVLSENLTGVLGKRVQRILGLESFRVDPFLAGADNDPTARITISERLSKDLVVTFSRNLTTSQEQIVIIEYDVGRNLSMVATRDEDGRYGLDFRFRKRIR